MTFSSQNAAGLWESAAALVQLDTPTIYDHLRATDNARPRLDWSLPDDTRVRVEGALRWAPGAFDGVATHHMLPESDPERAKMATDAFIAFCNEPTGQSRVSLAAALSETSTLRLVDDALQLLTEQHHVSPSHALLVARWLLRHSDDREVLKFAIAVAGVVGLNDDDLDLLMVLGRHDEFTLFVVVAIARSERAEPLLYELAQTVTGWGRIHCVERLAQTTDREITRWMLRCGFSNSVLDEYLAWICATTGDLATALAEPTLDDDLMDGAAQLIRTLLLGGGAAAGMAEYREGALAIERFLAHVPVAKRTLQQLLTVAAIRRQLEDSWHEDAPVAEFWTAAFVERAKVSCAQLIDRNDWHALITHAHSGDQQTRQLADRCEKILADGPNR